MKIRLDSYDDIKFFCLNIVVKSVFQNEDKYNPQIHIHDCEYDCEYEP